MKSSIEEIIEIATSDNLTYQQKLFNMANAAERMVDPQELLGYSIEEMAYIENGLICDLNEGYAMYRPRYIVPDYSVFVKNGCQFLELDPPKDIDELLDGLLILYKNVPSITSFPVFIGHLDQLINPFITDEAKDYVKIKRFLNHVDKTIPDSFCHGDIGPEKTIAGELILKAVVELQNPTPNLTLKYDPEITEKAFALKAIETCLKAAKPSFSNNRIYVADVGSHAIVSCYNALPTAGGAYTLPRLRLGTIAKESDSFEQFIKDTLPKVVQSMASMMDKRIRFIVESSHFFETSFLVNEGYICRENFTAMFGIVGLADAVNYFLELENVQERFGLSARGNVIGHEIMKTIEAIVKSHEGVYVERTHNRYLLHGQVGASIMEEDKYNTPAHRIPVGEEPELPIHLNQAIEFHPYFPSGTGDLFAFDQTYLEHLDALLDIINGAFHQGCRYLTTYLQNQDLIRVTGYLVKRSEVEKANNNQVVLRDTTIFGKGSNDNANVFNRRTRIDGK
jgi:YjjI family glycine radical enzyme